MAAPKLTSSSSVNLNDYASFMDATLTGASRAGWTHISKPKQSLKGVLGDRLVAAVGSDLTTLNAGTFSDTLVALGNGDVVIQNNGGSASLLGDGTTMISLGSAAYLAKNTINGGAGLSTLAVGGAGAKMNDSLFANDFNISLLSLQSMTGNTALTLGGSASAAGFSTVLGGSGNDTLVLSPLFNHPVYLDAGAGSDLINLSTPSMLASDWISGSMGVDTLALGASATLGDAFFGNHYAIEVLSLTGSSEVTLGANAQYFISTVIGGSGQTTLTQGEGFPINFIGSKKGNLITINNGNFLIDDTILGGTGVDTVSVVDYPVLPDSAFSNLKSIEVLNLPGSDASYVTLGAAAKLAGITKITGVNSLTQMGTDTLKLSISGTTLGDSFSIGNATLLGNDTISGGGGIDTLCVNAPASIADKAFARVNGIEVLSLSGASAVTIGSAAQAAGISTVIAGNGNTKVDASKDASTLSLFGQSGQSDTLIAGSANDLLQGWSGLSSLNTSADLLVGGAGIDTFVLGDALGNAYGSRTGAPMATISGFNAGDVLQLHNYGGGAADYTVNATNPAKTLILHGSDTVASVNVSKGQASQILQNAAFIGSTQGHLYVGTDPNGTVFNIPSVEELALDTIVGGGYDTIHLMSPGEVPDSSFANVSGCTWISLTGSSGITLDANAFCNGIRWVCGGDGASTIEQNSGDPWTFIDLSASGGGNLLTFNDASLMANDTILGGGNDTLRIESSTIWDDEFANKTHIAVLSLSGNSVAWIGDNVQGAGISTVIAGTGNTCVDAEFGYFINGLSLYGQSGGADTLIAGYGNDLVQGWSGNASLNTSSDTLTGGAGSDLFVMAVSGSTNNAYGKGGVVNATAAITDFEGGSGKDRIQLHQFGGAAADYSTKLNGSVLDIWHTSTQTPQNLIAQMTLASGTFSFANNAVFV